MGNWAMERQFFFDIGGLDTDMKLWGGENIDLSIRVCLILAVSKGQTR